MTDNQKRRDFIVDKILVELGEFGRFHLMQYFLLSIIVLFVTVGYFSYVFTAGQLDYRCKIPDCDRSSADSFEYETDWLHFAVPFKADGKPALCQRFQYVSNEIEFPEINGKVTKCHALAFNRSVIESCEEFVFAPGEITIVNEFNITCADKQWQLAMIGSLGYIAELSVQPICAYMSDKYGRRPILIASLLLGGIFGTIKSFSTNYSMFATMEFLTAFVSGGAYMTIFIMAIESAGPTTRVFSGTLISFMFSFSQAVCGLVAMMVPNFRTLLQVLYVPNLLMLTFVWMVPESVRWLMINGKLDEASSIIAKASKMNGVQISKEALTPLKWETTHSSEDTTKKSKDTFWSIMRSRILAVRLLVNCSVWFLMKLIYFGMMINSVALAGDKYINFIVVSAVDLPSSLVSSLLMKWMGRKWTLIASFALTGVACVATDFIPEDTWLVVLVVYLTGKFFATVAYAVLYVYSTEQFPTSLRHSSMNACYSTGTVGSILAPFTMLLVSTWPSLPLLMFGGSALLSAGLVLVLPETKNTRLPDTIAEAEYLTQMSGPTSEETTKLKL